MIGYEYPIKDLGHDKDVDEAPIYHKSWASVRRYSMDRGWASRCADFLVYVYAEVVSAIDGRRSIYAQFSF
jgi:hypothetical protein